MLRFTSADTRRTLAACSSESSESNPRDIVGNSNIRKSVRKSTVSVATTPFTNRPAAPNTCAGACLAASWAFCTSW